MLPYWILLFFFGFFALTTGATRVTTNTGQVVHFTRRVGGLTLISLLVLTMFIGLRFNVGGDWSAYKVYLLNAMDMSLIDALSMSDPGYWVVNVIATSLGWDIAGVNLICGLIFSAGLLSFANTLPRPWLAVVIAVPYMIIVVGMGYTRQSVALGFLMFGLTALSRGHLLRYIALILTGATFHMTSVIMIPIAALIYTRNRVLIFGIVGVISFIAYFVLLQDNINDLIQAYVVQDYQSSGALIRLALNAIPALIYLTYRSRFGMTWLENQTMTMFALASLGLFILFFLTDISTAIDRLALYFMPLQLAILSRLPDVVFGETRQTQIGVLGIIIYSAIIMAVWLLFASNSPAWLPYQTLFAL